MKPHSRKKGLIPLLLIFLIYASGCQTPSAQSSFSSSSATSSQEISSVTESSLEQSSIDESESSLEQSSPEDSSQEDSSEEPSSNQEPPHEHSPLPDDGDCTTPIVCSCNHVMIVGEQAHRFDNACDTSCNNVNCTHVRRVSGHKDADNNGKCDNCSADVPKNGGFELPEDSFH